MGRGLLRILCPCLKHDEKQDSSQPQLPEDSRPTNKAVELVEVPTRKTRT